MPSHCETNDYGSISAVLGQSDTMLKQREVDMKANQAKDNRRVSYC